MNAATKTVAITERLEHRRLLSGGGLPLSALPYLYIGPVFHFSRDVQARAGHTKPA